MANGLMPLANTGQTATVIPAATLTMFCSAIPRSTLPGFGLWQVLPLESGKTGSAAPRRYADPVARGSQRRCHHLATAPAATAVPRPNPQPAQPPTVPVAVIVAVAPITTAAVHASPRRFTCAGIDDPFPQYARWLRAVIVLSNRLHRQPLHRRRPQRPSQCAGGAAGLQIGDAVSGSATDQAVLPAQVPAAPAQSSRHHQAPLGRLCGPLHPGKPQVHRLPGLEPQSPQETRQPRQPRQLMDLVTQPPPTNHSSPVNSSPPPGSQSPPTPASKRNGRPAPPHPPRTAPMSFAPTSSARFATTGYTARPARPARGTPTTPASPRRTSTRTPTRTPPTPGSCGSASASCSKPSTPSSKTASSAPSAAHSSKRP